MSEEASKDVIHLVLIPVTGVGLYGGFRGDEWYKARVEIFKQYTLKSLQAQTNKDFVVWMTFRPQERHHWLTLELAYALKNAGLHYVFTYDGLPYWDDKFGGSWKTKLKNIGRVVRGCYRNGTWLDLVPNLLEIFHDKNASLIERIGRSVKKIEDTLGRASKVLLTRIDSDDMFRKDAIDCIHDMVDFSTVKVFRVTQGYITDGTQVAEYNPKTNPPFHTLIMDGATFFDAQKHLAAYRGYRSHEDMGHLFREPLESAFTEWRLFCVTTTNPKNHISTGFNHPYRGKTVDPSVLKDFGL